MFRLVLGVGTHSYALSDAFAACPGAVVFVSAHLVFVIS